MRVPPIDRNMAIIVPFLVVGIGLRIWGQSSAQIIWTGAFLLTTGVLAAHVLWQMRR